MSEKPKKKEKTKRGLVADRRTLFVKKMRSEDIRRT
jgi:hypothetical protein